MVKYRDGKSQLEGGFSAIPLEQVPHGVIETAIRAANLMGDGPLRRRHEADRAGPVHHGGQRQSDVNHGIEDAAEKDKVWEKILHWFWQRLEA